MTTILFRVLLSLVGSGICWSKRLGDGTYKHDGPTSKRHLQDTYFDNIGLSQVSLCGCDSCFDKGVNGAESTKRGLSCAELIMWLVAGDGYSEEAACTQIAQTKYAGQCGAICDPAICDGRGEGVESKIILPEKTFCGCKTCTPDVWMTMAGPFSCGSRISYVADFQGQTELDSCRKVAGQEFVDICGACNPDTCEKAVYDISQISMEETTESMENETPTTEVFEDIPLLPEFPLYCFPEYNERVRYANVWGKYTVEVKESSTPCGPSDNMFSGQTVQVIDQELTLQFRKMGGFWAGSEVRVLIPQEEMPFSYGEYSFSLKSVQVIDTISGIIIDTVLPATLILGLFTWDATEDYARHENYNHEVDIEISRWNIDDLADIQYLVQPPGDPHKYRFFSGEGGAYRQAPQHYKFDWKPAEIDWSSSAGGGGHAFKYGTRDALNAGQPDYTQCMPADVEVRMNVWNLFGSTTTPRGMEDHHVVEVVIDNFQFTPSGLTGLADGGTCSKDCHCEGSSTCQGNMCVSPGWETSATIGESDGSGLEPLHQGGGGQNDTAVQETKAAATIDEPPSTQRGMGNPGKALLTIFIVLSLAIAAVAVIRIRRNSMDLSRMSFFIPNRFQRVQRVVVQCWENTFGPAPSFEMKLKENEER